MLRRVSLLSALVLLFTATPGLAAKKYAGNPINVKPALVHPGGIVHIDGTRFPTKKRVLVQVFCPYFSTKVKATATLYGLTDAHGVFHLTYRAPGLVGRKTKRVCNVYALNTSGNRAGYDSMGFMIKR